MNDSVRSLAGRFVDESTSAVSMTRLRPRSLRLLPAMLATLVMAGCSLGTGEPDDAGSALRVRLMTGEQYTNTLAHVFGQDVADAVPAPLPPLSRTDGLLASGAASIGVTSDQIQQIQQAATTVAAKVVDEEHRSFLIPCQPASLTAPDDACAQAFLAHTGRLLYRQSLTEAKLAEVVSEAARAAAELEDFYAGLASALEGLLISPQMLFIVDEAEADPDTAGQQRLTAYSLASRLSFFLWNAGPDDELLKAAESGELYTRKGRERAVERMLASTRLEQGVRAFFDDMMGFNVFDSLAKDAVVYPMVTGATLADAREQTLRTVVDHLLVRNQDYRDLFTTRNTFMSMNLAAIYGVPTTHGWVPYEFPEDSQRGGLLTQVSFLASHSHPVRSSPTLRGKALRELFLCQRVPPPPPDVDFSLLEDAGDVPTARERLEIHASNPSCAGCHLITDPMGLALENFDGAGRFRLTENGASLDTRGNLDGAAYQDVDGLNQALRNHANLPGCLVNRVYSYGTGGVASVSRDKEVLAHFTGRFDKHEYKLPQLLRDIALSRAFSQVKLTSGTPAGVSQAQTQPHHGEPVAQLTQRP